MGYTFHWSAWSKRPYFILPGSEQKVHLQTMGYIPYLVDKHNTEGLKGAPPVSALPVREPASSSTALGADPGRGSGPPVVEGVAQAVTGSGSAVELAGAGATADAGEEAGVTEDLLAQAVKARGARHARNRNW